LLSGLLLVGMGILTIVLAITGPDMPTTGWRVTFTARLQHTAAVIGKQLHWLPRWTIAALLVVALAGIGYTVRRRTTNPTTTRPAITYPIPVAAAPAGPVTSNRPAGPAGPADACCTGLADPTATSTADATKNSPPLVDTYAGLITGPTKQPTSQDDTHDQ
jgi:cytochrome c-type biogenesis protein